MTSFAQTLALNIGELIVSEEPVAISTVLGSCVSVCLHNPETGFGGMIHYALPFNSEFDRENQEALRYGDVAIQRLIELFARLPGNSATDQWIAKIVGGANMLTDQRQKIGDENSFLAERCLRDARIQIVGRDVGGTSGRKVLFHTGDGRVQVALLNEKTDTPLTSTKTPLSSMVLAIGASTGGPDAVREVLSRLPATIPPIVIAQHIPPIYSKAFAERLHQVCAFEVREAVDGYILKSGLALVAPGNCQMRLKRVGGEIRVVITDDPPVNRHKPSIDTLFESVATVVGRRAVGVILTGMGADGAQGLLKMKQKGGRTIAQDEKSSVVFGMPKVASDLGAADHVLPLNKIADKIMQLIR